MRVAGVIIGMAALVMAAWLPAVAYAQEASHPDINLTLTETLSQLSTRASTREDLRAVPAPRGDKLSDTVRVTVTVGDPRCVPGEADWVIPQRSNRRTPRR